jgi:CheY-like chemotaxis protein
MPTTILLIENDAAFARELTEALEAKGFRVRLTGDGKEGLDLAREVGPAAIVLCVELPRMSGYSICQKLKKDEALRAIPLVLTSAEATVETFEQHKKLKARAEDYLLKPYAPADLIGRLARLTGLPEVAAEVGPDDDEEVVALEEDMGLDSLGEPEAQLPDLDLAALPDEPPAGQPGSPHGRDDEDLRLLDDAFEGISTRPSAPPPAAPPERPDPGAELDLALSGDRPEGLDLDRMLQGEKAVAVDEIDAAAASLPDEDEAPGRAALGGLGDDADLALGSLQQVEPGHAADALDALGGGLLDLPVEPVQPRPAEPPDQAAPARPAALGLAPASPGPAHDAELAGRLEALTRRASEAEAALAAGEAELRTVRRRAEALTEQARRDEAALEAAREEARRAANRAHDAEERARIAEEKIRAAETRATAATDRAAEVAEALRAAREQAGAAEAQLAGAAERARGAEAQLASARAAEEKARGALAEATRSLEAKAGELAVAAAAAARAESAEREVDELRTELIVARGEVEGARSEVEKRGIELKKRIADLEAANAKNEERVVKAYLKIKGDEKVRDKTRKALAIALQLLEDGLPAEAGAPGRPGPTPAKLE